MSVEDDFKAAVAKIGAEIDIELSVASAAILRAEKLSEEHGIPFYAWVSPLGQAYRPTTFEEKWSKKLNDELEAKRAERKAAGLPALEWGDENYIAEDTDELLGNLDISLGEYDGWQHSSVC